MEAAADALRAGRYRVNTAEDLHRVISAFIDALIQTGVRHACVCPGSRSTPLALELARARGIKLWMHLDERSAAFFGLGLARATREPVVLLATSGTAAANFFPAVVEANLGRVPLVVVTADRPHELRDNGAPQSIDQLRLYGEHVKWFFDLPEPDASVDQPHLVAALAARAVSTSMSEPCGPVHLNWPFREPLLPAADPVRQPRPRREVVNVLNGRLAPPIDLVQRLGGDLSSTSRGLIVAGPQDDPDLPELVTALAIRLGYPILADALSGVRRGPHVGTLVIDAYDAFLRGADAPTPDVVLRFGAIPTSKPLQQFLQRATRQILVDPGGWRDPTSMATDVLHVDPVALCEALKDAIGAAPLDEWSRDWQTRNAAARAALRGHLESVDELFEGKLFFELDQLLPEGTLLYAGNSMPVRDLDTFLPKSTRKLRCLSNRGANGIDGVVSTALGASAAHPGRVVLVIGDVSFYHDLNGLLASRAHGLDLLVVLVNNDGGGIFSFLPQAESAPDEFELLFGTPHGLDFRPFVEGYGGCFTRAHDWPSFRAAVEHGLEQGGLRVVEVPTERQRNVALHRAVWRAVAEALATASVC